MHAMSSPKEICEPNKISAARLQGEQVKQAALVTR